MNFLNKILFVYQYGSSSLVLIDIVDKMCFVNNILSYKAIEIIDLWLWTYMGVLKFWDVNNGFCPYIEFHVEQPD